MTRFVLAGLLTVVALLPSLPQGDVGVASSIPPRAAVGKVRWGYYVPYAANSLTSLREYISALDHLSPYWYRMDGEGNLISSGDGEINERNGQAVLDLARAHGVRFEAQNVIGAGASLDGDPDDVRHRLEKVQIVTGVRTRRP